VSGQGMSRPPDLTERRKQNRRDTQLWDRDLNGYAICPWCAALIYSDPSRLPPGEVRGRTD